MDKSRLCALFMTIALFLTSGCALFRNIDVAQQTVIIKSLARTGTYFGIKEGVDDSTKRAEIASLLKLDIAENVMALLDGVDISLSSANRELLLAKIPMELRPFLDDAIDILNNYIREANLSGMMDEKAVRLLRAFFRGVIEGCDLVLTLEVGINYDRMGTNSCTRSKELVEGR